MENLDGAAANESRWLLNTLVSLLTVSPLIVVIAAARVPAVVVITFLKTVLGCMAITLTVIAVCVGIPSFVDTDEDVVSRSLAKGAVSIFIPSVFDVSSSAAIRAAASVATAAAPATAASAAALCTSAALALIVDIVISVRRTFGLFSLGLGGTDFGLRSICFVGCDVEHVVGSSFGIELTFGEIAPSTAKIGSEVGPIFVLDSRLTESLQEVAVDLV